jgi:hypothetical protein
MATHVADPPGRAVETTGATGGVLGLSSATVVGCRTEGVDLEGDRRDRASQSGDHVGAVTAQAVHRSTRLVVVVPTPQVG